MTNLVGRDGLEPPTSKMLVHLNQGSSNRLSLPPRNLVELRGLEPLSLLQDEQCLNLDDISITGCIYRFRLTVDCIMFAVSNQNCMSILNHHHSGINKMVDQVGLEPTLYHCTGLQPAVLAAGLHCSK